MRALFFRLIILILILWNSSLLFAQSSFVISGYITEGITGDSLHNAVVLCKKYKTKVSTNKSGYYQITLPADSIVLEIYHTGYIPESRTIFLNASQELNFTLVADDKNTVRYTVKGNSYKRDIESTQMGQISVTPKEARMLPAFMGEVDLFKTLQLKPGVMSAGEGNSGLYVRGGGPDQNLVLLDNATVYNPSHLFGFFSIFNSDVVKSIDLYKSTFPARFSGRLSSVIDVKLPEGNMEKFHMKGGVGLISTRLQAEGPLIKNKLSYIISGRRTYVDVFTRVINKMNETKEEYEPIPDYYFQDLNLKFTLAANENNKFTWNNYWGRDHFKYRQNYFNFKFAWGNQVSSLNWNHKFNDRMQHNLGVMYSGYDYHLTNTYTSFEFRLGSGIKDVGTKYDVDFKPNDKHHINFGSMFFYHHFNVGRLKAGTTENDEYNFEAGQTLNGLEGGVYFSDDWDMNIRWKLNYGLRWTCFYNYRFYNGIEPRLAVRYLLTEKISLKASYARMYQYIHLASNSGASLPTDIWYPSTPRVRPQTSDQVSAGINTMLFKGKYLFTNEAYYKWMDRQIDYRDGANLFFNNDLESEFVYGKGTAYGNEIYLEKKSGRLTGWIGYTLSWTWRQFEHINKGEKFPARYDRRHDGSVVAIYKLSERVLLSGTWVYGTGNAVSLPVGRVMLQDVPPAPPVVIPLFTDRNAYRLAAYHRMDLGLVWKLQPKWGEADLTFSIYNVYNRRNTYFIYFEEVRDEESGQITRFRAKKVSLFPVIPAVTFNFSF